MGRFLNGFKRYSDAENIGYVSLPFPSLPFPSLTLGMFHINASVHQVQRWVAKKEYFHKKLLKRSEVSTHHIAACYNNIRKHEVR